MTAIDTVPLSFNQETHVMLDWLARQRGRSRPPSLPMVLALAIDGALNVDALEGALNDIIQRHLVLRTSFRVSDAGICAAHVWPEAHLHVSRASVPCATDDEADHGFRELVRRVREERERPFPIDTPPLMRATLFATGRQRHVLFVTLHHLVADGWSVGVLHRELLSRYDCRAVSRTPSWVDAPPPLPMQYGEFARRQREQFRQVPAALARYWTNEWATYGQAQLKPGDLPASRGHLAADTSVPGYQRVTLDAEELRRLRALARSGRMTTCTLGLSAIAVVFHAYTRRTTLAWWTYAANRTSTEAEQLIGWCAHGRPFGIRIDPDESFSQLLARVRDRVCEMHEHQEMPLPVLWDIIRRGFPGSAAPAATDEQFLSYDFLMMRDDSDATATCVDGVMMRSAPSSLTMSGHWPSLGLWWVERRHGVTLECRYANTTCEPAQIAALLGDLARVLAMMADHPEASVSTAPV